MEPSVARAGVHHARARRGEQGRFGPGGRTARHRSSGISSGPGPSPGTSTRSTQRRRGGASDVGDLASLELDFVVHARAYGVARGIQPATWREAGVSEAVLRRAGITA